MRGFKIIAGRVPAETLDRTNADVYSVCGSKPWRVASPPSRPQKPPDSMARAERTSR